MFENIPVTNEFFDGNGVGDDKAVYAYVPALIEYYLGEKPLLPNAESGGYSIVIDPKATAEELDDALLLTLRSASALEAYRRSFQSSTSPTHVAASCSVCNAPSTR